MPGMDPNPNTMMRPGGLPRFVDPNMMTMGPFGPRLMGGPMGNPMGSAMDPNMMGSRSPMMYPNMMGPGGHD